jgi:hypothetical protein
MGRCVMSRTPASPRLSRDGALQERRRASEQLWCHEPCPRLRHHRGDQADPDGGATATASSTTAHDCTLRGRQEALEDSSAMPVHRGISARLKVSLTVSGAGSPKGRLRSDDLRDKDRPARRTDPTQDPARQRERVSQAELKVDDEDLGQIEDPTSCHTGSRSAPSGDRRRSRDVGCPHACRHGRDSAYEEPNAPVGRSARIAPGTLASSLRHSCSTALFGPFGIGPVPCGGVTTPTATHPRVA